MPEPAERQLASVKEAFNGIAEVFEETLENEATRALRRTIYNVIRPLVPAGGCILDINCGIGIDTVSLAKEGYHTTGVDISPRMIDQARARARASGVNTAEFFVSSVEDLSFLPKGAFDLVLSNFGGLNCIRSLDRVAQEVSAVTRSGGYFVAIIMPPVSLWEILAGVTRLDTRAAFRRFGKHVEATGFGSQSFQVFYHSSKSFVRTCDRWFTTKMLIGLNVFSPPPHALRFRQKYRRLSTLLERGDNLLARLPILRSLGDHYLVILQSTSSS